VLKEAHEIWQVGAEEPTSDEEEPGVARPKRGAGRVGKHSVLQVPFQGKTKPSADGAGLCSPGRWLPEHRTTDTIATKMREALLSLLSGTFDMDNMACELALQRHKACPFSEELMKEGRRRLLHIATGTGDMEGDPVARQPFYLNSLAAVARVLGDPDWRVLSAAQVSFQAIITMPCGVGCCSPTLGPIPMK